MLNQLQLQVSIRLRWGAKLAQNRAYDMCLFHTHMHTHTHSVWHWQGSITYWHRVYYHTLTGCDTKTTWPPHFLKLLLCLQSSCYTIDPRWRELWNKESYIKKLKCSNPSKSVYSNTILVGVLCTVMCWCMHQYSLGGETLPIVVNLLTGERRIERRKGSNVLVLVHAFLA